MREGVFLRGSGPLVSKILPQHDDVDMGSVIFHSITEGGIGGFEIQGYGERPAIDCSMSSPWIRKNRIISGNGPMASAVYCERSAGPAIRIEDNLIEVPGLGIGINCNTSDPVIADNRFLVGDDPPMATGIECDQSSPLILHNQMRLEDDALGIKCTRSSNPIIANNHLAGNGRSGMGLMGFLGGSFQVVNNLITGTGVAVWSAPDEAVLPNVVENNVVWDNGIGIRCRENGPALSAYNLFWDNDGNYTRCAAGAEDLEADPLFQAAEADDFGLRDELAGEMKVAEKQAGTVRIVSATAVEESSASTLPLSFSLSPNYPNPFNPSTTIPFTVPAMATGDRAQVDITVYDLLGQRVRTLANGGFEPGVYRASWDGRDDHGDPVASGVYLYRLRAGEQALSQKAILVR